MHRLVLVSCALFLLPASAPAATVLSSCGQTVSDAVLAADLDCSGTPGFAVVVSDGGHLDLAGYTVTASEFADVFGGGVSCLGDCTIDGGGGTIRSVDAFSAGEPYTDGIVLQYPLRGRVQVSDVTVRDFFFGITGFDVTLTSVTVEECGGVSGRRLTIVDSTVTKTPTTISRWYQGGAYGRILTMVDSTISGGSGVGTVRAELLRSTITNMHGSGMQPWGTRRRVRLYAEDSTISGNCLLPSEVCADILSTARPVLVNTTCGTSLRPRATEPAEWPTWEICAND